MENQRNAKTKQKIALIGMMGTYKSSAGKLLARRMGLPFADLDDLIVNAEQRSVAEIFSAEGEDYFRERETELLRSSVCSEGGLVLALGGGTPLKRQNAEIIQINCTVVFLKAAAGVLLGRIGDASSRPLLKNNATVENIAGLNARREPVYAAIADFTLDNSLLSSEQTAEKIADWLKNKNKHKNLC